MVSRLSLVLGSLRRSEAPAHKRPATLATGDCCCRFPSHSFV